MPIPFTQYLRPDGRTRPALIDRDPEIEAIAHDAITKGVTFTAELLGDTNLVMLNAEHNGKDIAAALVMNGPGVPDAVDKLVRNTSAYLATENTQ